MPMQHRSLLHLPHWHDVVFPHEANTELHATAKQAGAQVKPQIQTRKGAQRMPHQARSRGASPEGDPQTGLEHLTNLEKSLLKLMSGIRQQSSGMPLKSQVHWINRPSFGIAKKDKITQKSGLSAEKAFQMLALS